MTTPSKKFRSKWKTFSRGNSKKNSFIYCFKFSPHRSSSDSVECSFDNLAEKFSYNYWSREKSLKTKIQSRWKNLKIHKNLSILSPNEIFLYTNRRYFWQRCVAFSNQSAKHFRSASGKKLQIFAFFRNRFLHKCYSAHIDCGFHNPAEKMLLQDRFFESGELTFW